MIDTKPILMALALGLAGAIAPPSGNGIQEPGESVEPQEDELDGLLEKAQQKELGLHKLDSAERTHVARLLLSLGNEIQMLNRALQVQRDDEEAARALYWYPADEWLEREGYTRLQAAIVSVDGKDYFVVKRRFGTYATEDIPLLFPSMMFAEGEYWCDEAIMGGISSIIVNGREHRFMMSTWEQL